MPSFIRFLPVIGALIVATLAVENFKQDKHTPTGTAPGDIQLALAFDDPQGPTITETEPVEPEIEVVRLTAQRILTGDRLGGRYRISAAFSLYPFRSAPDWDITYSFRFDGQNLLPIRFVDTSGLRDASRSRGIPADVVTRSVISDCTDPRPQGLTANQIALSTSTVCNITTPDPDSEIITLGLIIPDDVDLNIGVGGQTCAAEVVHWHSLPQFGDNDIAACVIVDRSPETNQLRPNDWMDVIVYQRRGDGFDSIGHASRNAP